MGSQIQHYTPQVSFEMFTAAGRLAPFSNRLCGDSPTQQCIEIGLAYGYSSHGRGGLAV
jgi:hypothetical protein